MGGREGQGHQDLDSLQGRVQDLGSLARSLSNLRDFESFTLTIYYALLRSVYESGTTRGTSWLVRGVSLAPWSFASLISSPDVPYDRA